jgi:histidinol dehydrogenase
MIMPELNIQQLATCSENFWPELDEILAWESVSDDKVNKIVRDIIARVRSEGDKAVIDYTNQFDRMHAKSMDELTIRQAELDAAVQKIDKETYQALQQAADRVRLYHEKQKTESWSYQETDGTLLGQQVTPLERVGIYVPGGKAAYPSSVIMNAMPAKVAGVKEVIMVVPTPDGVLNDLVLAAAKIAGVDAVFAIGGAQAVAALAYGTETVPAVDKIVGPGNIFVATAKSMVFGKVGIDMIAGPSEIAVVCDGKTDPDWIAMDLFSQAEHDEDAQSILISQDQAFLDKVKQSMEKLMATMPRSEIIVSSLNSRGAFIKVSDLDEAIQVVNYIAPEHLELSMDDPQSWAKKVKHAGAIFMGRFTAEAIGDYCAGPNHVLPTSRTARFSSPLGVYDFQKRSSLIMCSEEGASELGEVASVLANGEGLVAHARSAEYRIKHK